MRHAGTVPGTQGAPARVRDGTQARARPGDRARARLRLGFVPDRRARLSGFRELIEAPWWIGFFWGTGVLAVGSAIVSLFFSLGRRPPAVRATATPDVEDPRFLDAVAGLVNSVPDRGGTARLLNNGDQVFPALLADIRGAKGSVHWLAYIWEPGRCSDQVFAALIERAKAGVAVRVLLDGVGGMRCPD